MVRVGLTDSSKRSFEVYGTPQHIMRCVAVASVLALLLLMPAAASQSLARDAPNCLERDIDQLLNSLSLDNGVCVKVDLGTLQPGDVYEVSVSIINDAIDLLFFDQNQILTYDADNLIVLNSIKLFPRRMPLAHIPSIGKSLLQ